MLIFAIVCGLLLLIALVLVIVFSIHSNFVEKHSILLKEEKKINDNYSFYESIDLDQYHTYDNEAFYDSISPEDYLIYQLQFISSKVKTQINQINYNKAKYDSYCSDLSNIIEDGYDLESKRYNKRLLNYYKNKKYKLYKKTPDLVFRLCVTLRLSLINGKVYDAKQEIFNENDICNLISRLNNRNGKFFLDRGVWESICRVERGKVSNKLRFAIYKRDGYRCRYCHKSQASSYLEIDHIMPIAKGGKSEYNNLQTLCQKCNRLKGDKIIN